MGSIYIGPKAHFVRQFDRINCFKEPRMVPRLKNVISADSCSEINDFQGGESSAASRQLPELEAQRRKEEEFSIYLLRTKLPRD